jgi:hypothetical protein
MPYQDPYKSPYDRWHFLPVMAFRSSRKWPSKEYLDFLGALYKDLPRTVQNFSLFTVDSSTQYRPELIAHQTYGDKNLWWVICFYNKIIHPTRDLAAGKVLKIPDESELVFFFERIKGSQTQVGSVVTI